MKKKRILLTGAAGRVGRLVRPLLQETYALRLCDLAPIEASGDDEIIRGDLADPALARRAVEGVTAVVHLAGLVAADVSFEDTLAPNYRAVLALLEACRRGEVRRLVYASSHHILGLHAPGVLDPATPLAPDGFYGLSKAFGEAACALYAGRFGISTLIIRIGNADEEIVDGRRERLWVSGRDLVQLMAMGIEREGLGCEIVYGASNCPDPIFANEEAQRLGYRPVDRAEEHRAPAFKPFSAMGAADGAGYVGGLFAAGDLPEPFGRTRG
jgi:uronate dehydrogenase